MKTLAVFVLALVMTADLSAHADSPADRILGTEPGRFGKAMDGAGGRLNANGNDLYGKLPLTVECWAKLRGKKDFNILVANEMKESQTHWEIYSYAQSGVFSAFLPGYVPNEIRSGVDIADGEWHYVAMAFDGKTVRLYVDGKETVSQAVAPAHGRMKPEAGALTIGGATARDQFFACDGWVDEVRLSSGVRAIGAAGGAPFQADEQTIGLWHLDTVNEKGEAPDSSRLANPARSEAFKSLDELDTDSFKAGPSPLASEAEETPLRKGASPKAEGAVVLSLGGRWEMAEGGEAEKRLAPGEWTGAIPAAVPGSVHGALTAAGKISDPKFGMNDAIAREQSFKTWWFKRTFKRPEGAENAELVFDGVAIHCTVWLNGTKLGEHEGMFGGPRFAVQKLLRDQNELIVKIEPAPQGKSWFAPGDNDGWKQTVVFNNVWGWHYSNIPALGIWRSVRIEGAPTVRMIHPFVATRDAQAGVVDVAIDLDGPATGWQAALSGAIEPENFKGESLTFEKAVTASASKKNIHLRLTIPNPQLWWPNDLGPQNLYRLKLSLKPQGGGIPDYRETTFGVRTIEMAPAPGGLKPIFYNWTFVINGRPTFVKGSGWCTMDSSMDFSRERYDRVLSLAKLQHIQMLRCWGSGMPETDDFYDLCDRYGILAIQEWPTAWNSHETQPYDLLEETVRLNTLRLRNHPALAMWGGGNESSKPFGKAIDMMGRYAIELDGSRPFHRGEGWGGSTHNYDCWWGEQPLEHNLGITALFFGEFGIASMPMWESVQRYLPANEKNLWPAPSDKVLAHHTPVFNTMEDMKRLWQFGGGFTAGKTMQDFIAGTQLGQVVGVRHPLELARTRWPECTGALYYKMNDNYPAASWSCVDWYGAPKMAHYFFQDSFAPLHACVIFTSLNNAGKALALPVFVLDDADALKEKPWSVLVRAYDAKLGLIASKTYKGNGAIDRVSKLGEFALTAEQTSTTPLLVVAEVRVDDKMLDRTFYFTNHEAEKDSLFHLPRTKVSLRVDGGKAVVANDGKLPAVAVNVARPGHLDTFACDDNYFWLDAGESKSLSVNETHGLVVDSWNQAK